MSDGANDQLRRHILGGAPVSHREPRRRALMACQECGKEVRGQPGLMQHQNAKHGARWTWAEIDRAPRHYEDMSHD